MSLVLVDAVSKTYRDGTTVAPVLQAASLRLEAGETTSLTGASGSGKSTLLALIAGLMRPDAGRIVFDGHEMSTLDEDARARVRGTRVGIVLQSGNLIPFLTALENVELAQQLGSGARDRRRATALLAELGLADRAHHLPRRMSGGEAQRVAVAVALANEPELLLADEITGELDSYSAEQVMTVLVDAWRRRGLTVLFVTHNDELAARAQRRLRLANGAVVPA